ncbi:hypothetical protein SELMODRAFT_112424 [Selaginella moellendorffii]|uniref:Pentacotripeptide-repeat region of PRORP domain-containing protein n=1 Tax=Selaginella moellendorffii TaxID=88036 RepID=D8SAU7_SELML|nr:hypothetical protein SELMODRAFT_112424 [Selaginella moellendorffii]
MLSRTSLDPKVLTADTRTYGTTGNAHQLERSACLAALKSCSRARDVESGRQIHANARESGVDSDSHVASSLVAMYMKCGSVVEAQQAFDRIPRPDAVCWNALISGYAENGEAEVALQLFRSMQQCCGANSRTFAAALAACSTLAAAEEGRKFFHEMPSRYGIVPEVEHFHCVVDLLSRANQRVQGMTKRWNFEAYEVTWTTIAGGVESRSGDATLVTKQEWAS